MRETMTPPPTTCKCALHRILIMSPQKPSHTPGRRRQTATRQRPQGGGARRGRRRWHGTWRGGSPPPAAAPGSPPPPAAPPPPLSSDPPQQPHRTPAASQSMPVAGGRHCQFPGSGWGGISGCAALCAYKGGQVHLREWMGSAFRHLCNAFAAVAAFGARSFFQLLLHSIHDSRP